MCLALYLQKMATRAMLLLEKARVETKREVGGEAGARAGARTAAETEAEAEGLPSYVLSPP